MDAEVAGFSPIVISSSRFTKAAAEGFEVKQQKHRT